MEKRLKERAPKTPRATLDDKNKTNFQNGLWLRTPNQQSNQTPFHTESKWCRNYFLLIQYLSKQGPLYLHVNKTKCSDPATKSTKSSRASPLNCSSKNGFRTIRLLSPLPTFAFVKLFSNLELFGKIFRPVK